MYIYNSKLTCICIAIIWTAEAAGLPSDRNLSFSIIGSVNALSSAFSISLISFGLSSLVLLVLLWLLSLRHLSSSFALTNSMIGFLEGSSIIFAGSFSVKVVSSFAFDGELALTSAGSSFVSCLLLVGATGIHFCQLNNFSWLKRMIKKLKSYPYHQRQSVFFF